VVDADLKSYFDTIPHERLLALVAERVGDGRVLALVESFLRAGVLEEAKGWQPTERGTPQGGVISPLLANLYLNPLDHQMEKAGWEMVRYADDFVILCRNEAEAQAALAAVRAWVSEAGLVSVFPAPQGEHVHSGRWLREATVEAAQCNGGWMAWARELEPPINAGRRRGLPTVGCCPWRRNTRGCGQS